MHACTACMHLRPLQPTRDDHQCQTKAPMGLACQVVYTPVWASRVPYGLAPARVVLVRYARMVAWGLRPSRPLFKGFRPIPAYILFVKINRHKRRAPSHLRCRASASWTATPSASICSSARSRRFSAEISTRHKILRHMQPPHAIYLRSCRTVWCSWPAARRSHYCLYPLRKTPPTCILTTPGPPSPGASPFARRHNRHSPSSPTFGHRIFPPGIVIDLDGRFRIRIRRTVTRASDPHRFGRACSVKVGKHLLPALLKLPEE